MLDRYTKSSNALTLPLDAGSLQCVACGHRCKMRPGKRGVCQVRFNEEGRLRVPFGYVSGLQCDPIEKKPFYHVLPGQLALSFGMLGCDFHCAYCQNWETSQVLRDEAAQGMLQPVEPAEVVEIALQQGAPVVASTYNEPLITSEWAKEIFKLAKEEGLKTAYVSNGNATPEVLDYLQPHLDMYKVDLKGFQEKAYRKLGGRLSVVKETITELCRRGLWLEVVTLLVPGLNDSEAELRQIAEFLAGISPQIPWHVTAFHSDYRMLDTPFTPQEALMRAGALGREAGLQYVYAGNRPGEVGNLENTACPDCGEVLIERVGYRILGNHIEEGACPACGRQIPGVWTYPHVPGTGA
ncbi:MAG: AmmeMemoRadiSam system radical SAM enzyme [Candidatus Omnitrophica bacterium]|nr:AmmeMemoRadiSam system radical SAM enzyme [Candidatus Omnitrophota bacterium]